MTMEEGIHPSQIQQRVAQIRAELPEHVEIMAVSKGYSADHIRAAYAAGIRHFGESRIQEAQPKLQALQDLSDISWHLIGHLQTNKIKVALELFDWIDSVDSWKLAQQLDQRAQSLQNPPQICLQVKPAPDPQKYGWTIPELLQYLPQISQLAQLQVAGLMTILPLGLTATESLQLFQCVADLKAHINQMSLPRPLQIRVVSMGMSADYRLAIQAGSTMIRIGRFLFGASTPDRAALA